MSDYRRDSVDPTAPLTHADAEALISARLDGPLDPAMNRVLQAHLSTCDSCRAFAAEMESMATALRDFPSLPPSSAVSRRVRAEIRSGGSPMRKFSRWITTSRSAPLTALGGAAVALALVVASVFGNLGGDDGNNNGPSLGAPESAQNITATSEGGNGAPTTAASNSARQSAPTATSQVNVVAPEPTSASEGDGSAPQATSAPQTADNQMTRAADEPTQQAPASGNDAENPAPTQPAATGGADGGSEAPTAEPTGEGQPSAAFSAANEGGTPAETVTPEPTATPTEESTPEPQPTETPTEEPTNTPEPEPTETPTEEPTNTPEPTQTPTEEPTNTPEPEPTETPALEPTATPTEDTSAAIVASGDATPEPSPTPTASPTPEPTQGASIVPRGNGQADDQTQEAVETPTPEPAAATEEAGQGGDNGESPQIQPSNGQTQSDTTSDTGAADEVTPEPGGAAAGAEASDSTPEDASKKTNGAEASAPAGPLNFGDLTSADYSVSVYGTYLPGPNGNHAAEQRGGGLQIVGSNGEVIVSGYGYNPVWGGDGSLYTAGGAISEGASAINQWSGGDGPGFVTQGDYLDVPAGDGSGGFYFVRQLPGTATIELHLLSGGDPIWSADGYNLISQSVYIYNDVVYIPTDQGWLAVTTGGEMTPLGPAIQFTYDLLLDLGSGQIAFVDDGGAVYVAPASDPSAASSVGSISGSGGIAWTPYGLAIASGGSVTINGIPVIEGGGDLGAPIWGDGGLAVADAAAGGEVRIITDAEIQQALAQ